VSDSPLSYFDFPPPGSTITIPYPKKNRHYFGQDPRRKKPIATTDRVVVILTIEDGRQIPISIGAFLNCPTVVRSRWRGQVYDALKCDLRTLYLDRQNPCKLQLGIWNPQTGECVERIGEPFEQTAAGLLELKGTCEQILKGPPAIENGLTLAIYAAA
jgi:hypothetical protein